MLPPMLHEETLVPAWFVQLLAVFDPGAEYGTDSEIVRSALSLSRIDLEGSGSYEGIVGNQSFPQSKSQRSIGNSSWMLA